MNLVIDDLRRVVRTLPGPVRNALKTLGGARLFVAGGFIRALIAREHVQDVDLFLRDADDVAAAWEAMETKETFRSEFASSGFVDGRRVQIIHAWTFETPLDVIPRFDFSVSRAVVWWDDEWKKWETAVDEKFYADLAAKRIRYLLRSKRTPVEAGGTLARLIKYTARGYSAAPETVAVIVRELYAALPPHQRGTEGITTALRGVDPERPVEGVDDL